MSLGNANHLETIDTVIAPLMPEGSSVALFDFPNYSNVGDSAIWLGQNNYLKNKIKAKIVWVDDYKAAYRPLPKLAPDVIVVIKGGGNFGDLYSPHQNLREKLVSSYPKNRVIQFPQSIYFQDQRKKASCRKVLNSHRDFHLLARDLDSLAQAMQLHDGPSYLCPDLALCLGMQQRPVSPRHEIFCLLRSDKEGVIGDSLAGSNSRSSWVGDWRVEPDSWRRRLIARTDRLQAMFPRSATPLFTLKRVVYDSLAKERLLRGNTLLSSGKVVVTDRLHGHILCTLLDIPHVVLDNSYGKIANFRDAWKTGGEKCLVADRLEDALEKANGLLESEASRSAA